MARRTPITVGERTFATLGEAQGAVRAILYAYKPPGTVTETEHQLLLTDVVAMHPEADAKIGAGVERFEVRTNIGSPGFWIVRVDGSETDFSFLRALRPPDHPARVRVALRGAVLEQKLAVRDKTFAGTDAVACPITGERVTIEDCHVDHYDPQFIELAHRFAAQEGGYERIAVVTADGAFGTKLEDEALAQRWQEFHRRHANLRVVSVRANLSLLRQGVRRQP